MAESPDLRHGPQWRDALVSELRALSPRLDVPPAAGQATTVRQRLEAQPRPQARPPLIARWRTRILYPRWRAALIVALTAIALAVAIPQSRYLTCSSTPSAPAVDEAPCLFCVLRGHVGMKRHPAPGRAAGTR